MRSEWISCINRRNKDGTERGHSVYLILWEKGKNFVKGNPVRGLYSYLLFNFKWYIAISLIPSIFLFIQFLDSLQMITFINYYDRLANIVTKLFSLWLLGVLLGFHMYLINLMHMIKIHQLEREWQCCWI